jgi:hypothetical protein
MHKSETGEIAAKGFRATGLFPCDKNIFRSQDFPLASQDTAAAPVNHPALVKTSDQPSFTSTFSPFTFSEALRASDISAVPNNKESKEFVLQKFCWGKSYKENKKATKSKTNWLVSNALRGPSKRRKRVICRDPSPFDIPSDSDTDVTVPFTEVSTEKGEQDTDCVFFSGRFSEDRNVEEWKRCAKYFRWAQTLCVGVEENFVCELCQG